MPAIVVTSAPTDEPITVEEAKRHLRILHSDLDTEIESLIQVARDYCERFTQRTLRTAVTRTVKLPEWWDNEYHLPYPPLIGITSVTYYDAGNVQQTLAAGNYYVEPTTEGGGRLVFASTATIPSYYARDDAITVTYTAGYASAAAVPRVAVQAMKVAIEMEFLRGTQGYNFDTYEKCIKRLLSPIDWTGYR